MDTLAVKVDIYMHNSSNTKFNMTCNFQFFTQRPCMSQGLTIHLTATTDRQKYGNWYVCIVHLRAS